MKEIKPVLVKFITKKKWKKFSDTSSVIPVFLILRVVRGDNAWPPIGQYYILDTTRPWTTLLKSQGRALLKPSNGSTDLHVARHGRTGPSLSPPPPPTAPPPPSPLPSPLRTGDHHRCYSFRSLKVGWRVAEEGWYGRTEGRTLFLYRNVIPVISQSPNHWSL